jgi:hypothetical protein
MGIIVVIWTLPLCGENINQNEAVEPTCTQLGGRYCEPWKSEVADSNEVISGKESSRSVIGA